MAKTGRTDVVLNLKVSDGELSLIFDKAKKGFARLSQDQKDSLKLQEKQDAAAKKYSITKTTEGKSIAKTNVETREEIRLATLAQTQKIQVTKAVEKLAFANSKSNVKIQEHNVLAREQNRVLSLELNQKIQLKRSEERLAFAYSDTGKQIEKNNALAAEKNRQTKLEVSRDIELVKAQESLAFWTSKKGKELAKANLQAKEAQNQAKLLAIKEMEAADAAKELSNATKGVAKGFDQMKTTAGLSGAIVTEVGRTVSDAPYGLRGMGNNISQLASLFGMFSVNVKKSGRTMTQGFKQLGASMMGPIGIITGIQVLIALLQSGAFDKFFEWLSGSNKSLKLFSETLKEASQSAGDSIGKFNAYIRAVQDSSSSIKEKEAALKKLKQEYPDFNTELLKDKNNTQALTKAKKEYIKILKKQAISEAALSKFKKAQSEIVELEFKREEEARKAGFKDLEELNKFIESEESRISKITNKRRKSSQKASLLRLKEIQNLNSEEISEEEKKQDILFEMIDIQDKKTEDSVNSRERRIKEFKESLIDYNSELLNASQELLETTSRTQLQIIEDEQKAKVDVINTKKDEFKEKEELRLKNYIAQQEANKKLKGADVAAIDAAIERAREKTAKAIQESNNEADGAIAAINRVTLARVSNQQKLDELEKLKAGMAVSESSAETNLALMPEGMAKVEAEAALDQLRYDNKVLAAERELALVTTTEERRREILTQMALWEDEKRVTDLENEINVIDEKTRIQEQYISYLSGLSSVLSAIGSKNEGLRKVALVAEKSAAIANVVVSANKAILAREAAHRAIPSLDPKAAAVGITKPNSAKILDKGLKTKDIAKIKVGAGISIAAIAAGTIAGLRGSSDSAGGGGGATTVQPPDFNIIGSTGVNQLAEVIGGTTQQPIKAYVVSSEVTSAQELDRNIIDSASL
jgi:hypothetical protein